MAIVICNEICIVPSVGLAFVFSSIYWVRVTSVLFLGLCGQCSGFCHISCQIQHLLFQEYFSVNLFKGCGRNHLINDGLFLYTMFFGSFAYLCCVLQRANSRLIKHAASITEQIIGSRHSKSFCEASTNGGNCIVFPILICTKRLQAPSCRRVIVQFGP
jgi:hypothetical protein